MEKNLLVYLRALNRKDRSTHLLPVVCTDFGGIDRVTATEIRITCSNLIVLEHNDDSKLFGTSSNGNVWTVVCPAGFRLDRVRPTEFSTVD